MFQSLLFWIIGSGLGIPQNKSKHFRFQSLLFWIIGSGRPASMTDEVLSGMFQSLLFWIIGSGTNAVRRICQKQMFQSLLFWIIGSGRSQWYTAWPMTLVSILVVLDHWFGPVLSMVQRRRNYGFNPCCFGSLVRATTDQRYWDEDQMGFNPCCFGSLVRASAN